MTGREWSFLVWGVLGCAVVCWLVLSWASRGRVATLGEVVRRLSENRITQTALVLGWMWLGWHAFAR